MVFAHSIRVNDMEIIVGTGDIKGKYTVVGLMNTGFSSLVCRGPITHRLTAMKNGLIFTLLLISTTLTAQVERPKWEVGGGVRINYMGLGGGISGTRNSDGYNYDINYKDIGMDNYTTSYSVAIGGRYKKFLLEFGASRGSYKGGFTLTTDVVRDNTQLDSGAVVSGSLDLSLYALSTMFGLIQEKHDLGLGIGVLLLNMASNYTTKDVNGAEVKLGGDEWFPMPFLAVMGRLNFSERFRVVGSVGGAYYKGDKDGATFKVLYYTFDITAAYEFLQAGRFTYTVDVGYRNLFMDMDITKDIGTYHEKDIYSGPYATLRILFSSAELWKSE
jgi:hypothetical protein